MNMYVDYSLLAVFYLHDQRCQMFGLNRRMSASHRDLVSRKPVHA